MYLLCDVMLQDINQASRTDLAVKHSLDTENRMKNRYVNILACKYRLRQLSCLLVPTVSIFLLVSAGHANILACKCPLRLYSGWRAWLLNPLFVSCTIDDHSRVILRSVSGQGGDTSYINANYIEGYHKPRAYIATQVSALRATTSRAPTSLHRSVRQGLPQAARLHRYAGQCVKGYHKPRAYIATQVSASRATTSHAPTPLHRSVNA